LSEYLVEVFLKAFSALHFVDPVVPGFVVFRCLQNFIIFLLAVTYYMALGLSFHTSLLGLSLLSWAMTHMLYDSDLSFNTYMDTAFYLIAVILIIKRRDWVILLVSILSALNRETGALIPVLLFAARFRDSQVSGLRKVIPLISILAFSTVYLSLRFAYGNKPLMIPYGNAPGLELMRYNLGKLATYVNLATTFNLLPIISLFGWRKFPPSLQAFGFVLVPIWFTIHFVYAVVAETRLFLVPLAIVFIPGALFSSLHHK